MTLETLIATHGYTAVTAGTFLEGETVLILGGFAAHRGYLSLPWVLVCACAGSFVSAQLCYHIGKIRGRRWLDSRPAWHAKSERIWGILNRHRILIVLGFRFLYGFRSITPFVLGASRMNPVTFLPLNLLGSALWSALIGLAGYVFSHTLEVIWGDIQHFEKWIFIGLASLAVLLWSFSFFKRKNTPSDAK